MRTGKSMNQGLQIGLERRRQSFEQGNKVRSQQGYFDTYEHLHRKPKSFLGHILLLVLETIVYLGLMIYCYSLEASLQSLVVPLWGLSIIYLMVVTIHLISLIKLKKDKASDRGTLKDYE